MTSKRKSQSGFGAVVSLLILLVICIIGFAGWYVYSGQIKKDKLVRTSPSTASIPKENKTENMPPKSEANFNLPDNWEWYENSSLKVKVAYPKNWDTSLGFSQNLTVINESDAKLSQGCGDPACGVRYDAVTKKWTGTNVRDPILSVSSTAKSEAYLIPIKGAMYCGSYGLYIHYDDKFVNSILSLCEKNDDPNFQVKEGVLSKEGVLEDLPRVLESLTDL